MDDTFGYTKNLVSRKVIEESGFYCSNIIFDIGFTDEKN